MCIQDLMAGRLAAAFGLLRWSIVSITLFLKPILLIWFQLLKLSFPNSHSSFGGHVYDDIITLILEIHNSHFSHIFREVNVVAYVCAHYTCISLKHVIWLDVLSFEIRSILSIH